MPRSVVSRSLHFLLISEFASRLKNKIDEIFKTPNAVYDSRDMRFNRLGLLCLNIYWWLYKPDQSDIYHFKLLFLSVSGGTLTCPRHLLYQHLNAVAGNWDSTFAPSPSNNIHPPPPCMANWVTVMCSIWNTFWGHFFLHTLCKYHLRHDGAEMDEGRFCCDCLELFRLSPVIAAGASNRVGCFCLARSVGLVSLSVCLTCNLLFSSPLYHYPRPIEQTVCWLVG